ncbi:hypothetical protein A1Q2_04178 [Trichosporon asahii var. asahii CBS 8904]|uniref:DASH complex subunit SPC19 n=2 Tax=Trichosporon asahii var. asahii TaxID=189963 RepID=K1VQF5_TRIAC|nr:hypothetical protein A1Q1_03347 [Trichosporon asahii var. asahii CBS 2479]EJT47772.1 hypothetical protein A1Q1_03347 [Trichosporon asahii var. asahii CBS 2479]EKD01617.1 hypothetical protein A1Q2_04178 [Trichosporon asahii var. asahii CBS 8904]
MATRQSLFPAPRQSLHPSAHARQSYAPNALRQSLQVPSSDFLSSLEDCVASTEACVARLDATNKAFEPGIKDLPRIKRIFDHNVWFLVLPEPTVTKRRHEYASSLRPQIDSLVERAETLVSSESSQLLHARARLQQLESALRPALPAAPRYANTFLSSEEEKVGCKLENNLEGRKDLTMAQRRKIGMLRNKRERLERERAKLLAARA